MHMSCSSLMAMKGGGCSLSCSSNSVASCSMSCLLLFAKMGFALFDGIEKKGEVEGGCGLVGGYFGPGVVCCIGPGRGSGPAG